MRVHVGSVNLPKRFDISIRIPVTIGPNLNMTLLLHRKVDGFAYLCIKIERKKLATIYKVLLSLS
jgi:hypothetical protein